MRTRTYLFHSAVYNSVNYLFLADNIEDNNRYQRQQIGSKRQIIVCTELRLECQLCQRQRVLPASAMITRGVITSFHTARAVITATVACMGFIIGKIIFQKVRHVLAPSTLAASSSAIGIFTRYPVYRSKFIGI